MIESYFFMHYVVYKFYRKHNEDRQTAIITACCVEGVLFIFLCLLINFFTENLLSISLIQSKKIIWGVLIIFSVLEYILFFRKQRYLEVFNDFDAKCETAKVKKKVKLAKMINYCVLILGIIGLVVADYINHK